MSKLLHNSRQRLRTLPAMLPCALLLAGGCLCGAPPLAVAQDTVETQTLDAVYVTGSNIPRTDIETALPIQVITREDIERSGAINAAALLTHVSANLIGRTAAAFINVAAQAGLSSAIWQPIEPVRRIRLLGSILSSEGL